MASAFGSRATLATKLVARSSMDRTLPQHGRCFHRSRDDRGVPGTSTEMTADDFFHFLGRGVRPSGEEGIERHQDPGGAEAALQRVMTTERRLQHGKPVRCGRETLDGANLTTFRLDRERQAGARRLAVDNDCASATDAVLAADMRADRTERMAQCVSQQHTRLDLERG